MSEECTGRCYQKQWKVKPGSLKDANSSSRILPKEGETAQAARERCLGVQDAPDPAERLAALQRTLRQGTRPVDEKCTSRTTTCECVWPKWGEFLPEDEGEGADKKENWITMNVEGHFERGGCKFAFWGHAEVKVRERHGMCLNTTIRPKTAYVPEWDLDLDEEALAALSEESLALLKAKLA